MSIQGSATEWSLGCVISASWLPRAAGARFTQPGDHYLLDPCTYLVRDLELFDGTGLGGGLDEGDDRVAGDVVGVEDEEPDGVVAPQAVGDHRPDGVSDAAVGRAHRRHLRVTSQGLKELLPLGGVNPLHRERDGRFGVIQR